MNTCNNNSNVFFNRYIQNGTIDRETGTLASRTNQTQINIINTRLDAYNKNHSFYRNNTIINVALAISLLAATVLACYFLWPLVVVAEYSPTLLAMLSATVLGGTGAVTLFNNALLTLSKDQNQLTQLLNENQKIQELLNSPEANKQNEDALHAREEQAERRNKLFYI